MTTDTFVPEDLKKLRQWVNWKAVQKLGKPKPDKVPVSPVDGKEASVTNPRNWGAFEEAERMLRSSTSLSGIGFVFTTADPFVGVDLDNCCDPKSGTIEEWAQNIIESLNSYTEISPSGRGVHIIVKAKKPGNSCKRGNVEIYETARYFTWTGQHVAGTPKTIESRQEALNNLYLKTFSAVAVNVAAEEAGEESEIDIFELTAAEIAEKITRTQKGESLWNGNWDAYYNSQSEADLAFCTMIARHTRDPQKIGDIFVQSELFREKWNEPRGKYTYGEMTIQKALKAVTSAAQDFKVLHEIIALEHDPQKLTGEVIEQIREASLSEPQREQLCHAIAKKTGVSKSTLLSQAAPAKLRQIAIARRVIKEIGAENIVCDGSVLRMWNESGVWIAANDRIMKKLVHKHTPEKQISASAVASVLELIKTETFRKGIEFDHLKEAINCRNGTLEFDLIQKRWRLREHRRGDYFLCQIPVPYDPEAEAPRFEQFLREVFEGDKDSDKKALVVLEMLGYSLLAATWLEKFIILIGVGSNGKSVLLYVVEKLVGSENTAAVQPSELKNKFQRAHLHGKLVNIVTEIPEGSKVNDAVLKALVSGERDTVEHKNRDPFDFRPYCTCWFGTNHLPRTSDFSEALFRRAVILYFNNRFEGSKKDVTLKEKLTEELPGILNLALEALAGVYIRRALTECPSSTQAILDWKSLEDQVAQFIEDECTLDSEAQCGSQQLYSRYRQWAQEHHVPPLSQNNFTRRLRFHGVFPHKGAGGMRMLKGITFEVDIFS